jgi:hypothetical protein
MTPDKQAPLDLEGEEEMGSSVAESGSSPSGATEGLSAAGEVDLPNYWRAVIGDQYTPAVLRNVRHMHPATVKEVFDRHLGTDVADVIAGLIFNHQIAENRAEFFIQEYQRLQDRTASQTAGPLNAGESSREAPLLQEIIQLREALRDNQLLSHPGDNPAGYQALLNRFHAENEWDLLRDQVCTLTHAQLCRLSRAFNTIDGTFDSEGAAINEWLKSELARKALVSSHQGEDPGQ